MPFGGKKSERIAEMAAYDDDKNRISTFIVFPFSATIIALSLFIWIFSELAAEIPVFYVLLK